MPEIFEPGWRSGSWRPAGVAGSGAISNSRKSACGQQNQGFER